MFLENMLMAAQQVGILYILVAVGFVADKTGIYKEKAARLTNDLAFYIVTPAIVTQAFLSMEYSKENAIGLLIAFACGMLIHVVGIVVSLPFFRKGDKESNSIFKYASIYGNCGYMALPLCSAVLGPQGVFYCSAVVIAFNIFSFTHGISLMSEHTGAFNIKKILLNPGIVSVVIGLPLFVFSVKLPNLIQAPLNHIASLNTPLAMLMFGTYLANTDLKTMFRQKQTYLVAILKLAVMPLIMLGIFKLIGIRGAMLTALIIPASAPTANNTVMFSAKYGKNVGIASKVVSVVSLISIITMPVMIALSLE